MSCLRLRQRLGIEGYFGFVMSRHSEIGFIRFTLTCIVTAFARVLYVLNELLKCLTEYLCAVSQRYSGAGSASKRPQQQAIVLQHCPTCTERREQEWPAPTRRDTDLRTYPRCVERRDIHCICHADGVACQNIKSPCIRSTVGLM